MVNTFSLKTYSNCKVSKDFTVNEFACKDKSDEVLIDVDFVINKLQAIRDHFNKPIKINSAYRTKAYNKKIGGATNSYHTKGMAFDIVVEDTPLDEVCKYAQSLGIKGIIRYNTFVHVDSRESIYFARNNNGKITKLSTF